MTTPVLGGKRVLVLGADTEAGQAVATALAEAGASLALVAAANDSPTAFAVQRLARKLSAPVSQAIDATNEMAVRVMVRQVSKELGGLDAVVSCADSGSAFALTEKHANRELVRSGGGCLLDARGESPAKVISRLVATL